MGKILDDYRKLIEPAVIDQLEQIGQMLAGKKIVHVNSTKEGGGVAEILRQMVPLTQELGIDAHWEIIEGDETFFQCTKQFHNLLQGRKDPMPPSLQLKLFEETNARNAEKLRPLLEEADIVLVHDPQPCALINSFPKRKGKWIWRCHIDASRPVRSAWRYLYQFVSKYDASMFSLEDFTQYLPHPIYLVPPSIDPFSDKNRELEEGEIAKVIQKFNIDPNRPMVLQVSRFDHFKDPIGVIKAFHLTKAFNPSLQLVLAGGGASDDPEGEMILQEVRRAAQDEPDIHVLFLPSSSNKEINALQRAADVVIQKSLKEGFGLTVTEALWKKKPVIGGNVGGIRLQVIDYQTGFLVNTPEGAALWLRYLLQYPERCERLGTNGHNLVKENFLLIRQLRDNLILFLSLFLPDGDRIEISGGP